MNELEWLFTSALQLRKSGQDFLNSFDFENETTPPIAFLINISFACELFLKYIIEKEGGKKTGHDMKDIYNEISNESKFYISSNICAILYSQKDEVFFRKGYTTTLEEHSNIFYEWRYIHQFVDKLTSNDINYGFLSNFSLVLEKRAYILRGQDQSPT
ncbi:hypothetical protein [Rasiella sp. SM2506]|uniref:hypothetical protein n=1 Tax=Rasiella sp. SM2506 TaxID=3423914 RepID=UPI003D7C08E4